MKTTVDIPDQALKDAIRFTKARTKREAIVIAVEDFNRRKRMAELSRFAGTGNDMTTAAELQAQRRNG